MRRNTTTTVGLAAGALVAATLTAVTGTLATQTPAQAACSTITVKGKAVAASGKVLRRHDFAVFLHDHDRPLAGGRTSRAGGYSTRFCRSDKLATYARRHTGHLNLDVLTHPHAKRGKFYIRVVANKYSDNTAVASRRFVAAKAVRATANARQSARGSGHATGAAVTSAAVVNPGLMFVQAVPHMQADYSISSDSIGSIKAVVGVDRGGWSAAGTVEIEDSTGFESAQTLHATKKHPRKARVVKPELALTNQYTCYSYNPYFGGYLGSGRCITESSGHWTGDADVRATKFRSCAAGPSNILRFSNRTQRYVQTSDGVKFSSSVSAGAMGSSLTVTATYGSDATVKLAIDQGGKKHRFCVGGNERYVSDSAKLYINLVKDSPPPCQPHLPCPRRGRD